MKPKETVEIANGWFLERRPNSFGEWAKYYLFALDGEGFLAARRGFQTEREAKTYAAENPCPKARGREQIQIGPDKWI